MPMWTLPNAPKRVRAQHQLSALFSGAQSLTFADHASEGVPSDRLDLLAGELRRERRISGSELSSGGHVVSNPVHTRERVEGSRKQQSSLALAIRGGSPAASPGRPAWAQGRGSAKMRGSSPRCPTGSSCDQLSCRDEPPDRMPPTVPRAVAGPPRASGLRVPHASSAAHASVQPRRLQLLPLPPESESALFQARS